MNTRKPIERTKKHVNGFTLDSKGQDIKENILAFESRITGTQLRSQHGMALAKSFTEFRQFRTTIFGRPCQNICRDDCILKVESQEL